MCSMEMLEDSLTQGGGDHNTVTIMCVERIAEWGESYQGGVLAVYDAIALEGMAERFISSCFLC